jgi:ABC-2 type transport system permease protein
MSNALLVSFTLFQREVWRFLRQRNRIVGAIGTPLVFWILIGSGLSGSLNMGVTYLQYFFPGTIVLVLFFTSIFSTIAVIEDRREGFLQGVLVAPVPRPAVVLGHLLGGTVLATLQGLLFVCLSPFLGLPLSFSGFFLILTMMVLISFGLTGLGYLLAWRVDSSQGFHAVMNLFLMPMWLMSGALFPLAGAPMWLKFVMRLNPLTYSVAAFQHGFFKNIPQAPAQLISPPAAVAGALFFGLLMYAAACWTARKND